MSPIAPRGRLVFACLSLLAVLLGWFAVAGCGRFELRDGRFGDESAKAFRALREPSGANELWGTDARSREVERNLGIQ